MGKVAVEGAVAPAPASAASAEAATPVEAAAAATKEVVAVAAPTEVAAPEAEAASVAAAGGDQLVLATTSGCMACHRVEMKVVGPSYKEVAAKYKGDAAAVDMLVEKVKTGSSGTWGQIPMPPNGHVPEEGIRAILSWLLTL
ncbi:MAG: c-type cytochrome [Candidatus Thiodiazotropha sp. (ex Lucinoma aequizonata)]|nr:c-type cytochrome [Candidatus Thiodiazotropha sp. (ex Lucinoma aequizonata)]MCU7887435.1 c-type cytochrome [Candidatus Thiodiazotropha sp. (ex Lucinoma aequizonata)]MCU7896594.1 c-type cytochrome [Candidatus Thiodiazotropha sp. (ex Lucinoma aequizonata)]MCU7900135.1 c-type cytochrome [Candidatus Thiodiazotropha sp. (ex Lucinoma aequizonata)]MCU7901428.1 c-type cytochrome [Candidatus Thiodiazotropha sp. (ex Lucinoma aequizonata)]